MRWRTGSSGLSLGEHTFAFPSETDGIIEGMERDLLEGYLAEGLSLEQIGKLTGRDGSTVAYWVQKYGLEAANRTRHAARGGIPRDMLESLVEEGLSMRKIASRVGMSQSTVRHWLRQYGLRTKQQDGPRPRGV